MTATFNFVADYQRTCENNRNIPLDRSTINDVRKDLEHQGKNMETDTLVDFNLRQYPSSDTHCASGQLPSAVSWPRKAQRIGKSIVTMGQLVLVHVVGYAVIQEFLL